MIKTLAVSDRLAVATPLALPLGSQNRVMLDNSMFILGLLVLQYVNAYLLDTIPKL